MPLPSSYTINFTVPVGISPITNLQPVLPLGSLVYDTTIDDVLLSSTDTGTYTLTIDPDQTLAVLATPATQNLTLTVTLVSPAGQVLGTATSPSPGAPALLPAVQSAMGGTYQIQVTGGPGEYTIEPTLNALIDPASYGGPSNGSIATATAIDPYANKFAGNDDRMAVLGTVPQPTGVNDGDALVAELNDVLLIDKNSGNVLQRYSIPQFAPLDLTDVALAQDGTFYVLGVQNAYTGVIFHMNLQGQLLGSFTLPVSDSPGYLSPEGFGLDPRDGSFWVPLINNASSCTSTPPANC